MNVRFVFLIFIVLSTVGCSGKKSSKTELNSIEKTVDGTTSTISGAGPVVADGVASSIVTITLKDSAGNPVAKVTPQYAATDSGGKNSYSACSVSADDGVSICAFSSTYAESKILSLTFPVTVAANDQIVFSHGPAAKLSIYYQPTSIIVNQKWGSPMIRILDAYDNLVTTGVDATAGLTVAVASGGGSITGTTTVEAVGGVANFKDLRYSKIDTFTFEVTKADTSGNAGTTSVSVTSAPIKMLPNVASRVGFATQPGGGTAGVAWAQQPVVEIRDVGGNLVPTATNEVTLFLTTGTGLLLGTITKAAVDGVVTFTDLNLQLVGTDKVITALSGSLTPAQSTSFTITPASPAVLVMTTQPGGGTAGVAWAQQPVVEIRDAYTNLCSTSTDAVALTLSAGTGTLSGSVSVNAVAGVASFSGLSLNLSGSDKILTASSTGTTPAVSNSFTISAAAAAQLAFTTQPDGGTAGVSWVQQPVVEIRDAYGNLVPNATDSVTVALTTGTGTLSGTASVSAVAGVASFGGLSLNLSGSDKILTASSGGLTTAASNAFTISAAAASQLAITTQPGGGAAGSNWAQQPVVEIRDVYGNLCSSLTDSVTVALTTGTGTLSGSASVNAVAGIASFAGLSLNLSGSNKVLTASSGGLTTAASNAFTISVAAASQLTITTQPGGGIAGTNWAQQPVVEIRDAYGNLVSGATDSVTVALTTGTGTLSGTASVNAVSGVASFGGLSLNLSGSNKVLTASSGGLTTAASNAFTISAAAVVASSSVTASNASRKANGLESVIITATLVDQYSNPISGKTVSLVSNRGVSDSISGSPGVSDASGVVNFTVTSLSPGASIYTATDTSDSLQMTTEPSVTFTDYLSNAGQSTWSVAGVSVAADGSTTATISATIRNAAGVALVGKTIALSSSRGGADTITGSPAVSDSSGNLSFTIKSTNIGEASLTMTGTDNVDNNSVLSSSIPVSFLGANPLADFQARLANSSASSMGPGVNSPTATTAWKNLFDLAGGGASLDDFGYNDTTSGWMTGSNRLAFDGSNDRVNFGTSLSNSLASLSFEVWVKTLSPTTGNRFIFGNGDLSSRGISIRTASDNSGKAVLTIGGDETYVSAVLADSPVAYYRLGDSSGSTAVATVGGNGAYVGTGGTNYLLGRTTSLGDNDTSVGFDGSVGYMTPDNIAQTTDFTIEAWIYPEAIRAQTMAARQDADVGYSLEMTADGKIKMIASGTVLGVHTFYFVTGASTLSVNTWYYIVGVRDGTSGELRVYLNGGLDNTSTGLTGTAENSGVNSLRIGSDVYNGGKEFQGRIDEPAIYPSVLSSTRISAHYSAGAHFACIGSSVLSSSSFTHLVGTFDDTTKALKLYVNGANECTITATGASPVNSNYPLTVGAKINDSANLVSNSATQSQVGDIRVYNSALSPSAISDNYNAVLTRFNP